jgi:hypothetical protein
MSAPASTSSEERVSAAVPPFSAGRVSLRVGAALADTASLTLDGWYDVNARFRIGVTTSDDARRALGAGRGLCLHACGDRLAGVAAETQVRLGPALVGRAALDLARFAPTAAAVELGVDDRFVDGRIAARVSPVLRLGIARRDLGNTDTAGALAQVGVRAWPTGGVDAVARIGLALDALGSTPSLGAAGGAWLELGAVVLTVRFGAAEVARSRAADSLFGELALAWST